MFFFLLLKICLDEVLALIVYYISVLKEFRVYKIYKWQHDMRRRFIAF